jgi:hypothetical protein
MEEGKMDMMVAQQKLLNGVAYESLPETSVAVARTFEKQFFQKSSYDSTKNEAICDFNTGAKFLNPRRSYLAIKIKTTVAGGANFGHGSVCNLIRRVVITTRSGVEVSRTEDYNILMAKVLRYGCPADWLSKFGENIGMTDDPTNLASGFDQIIDTGSRLFMIPLQFLSPFFAGDGRSLLPPQASAGLRVQLTFAPDTQALVSDIALQKYDITDIYVMSNLTTMVDSWQKLVNEESARDGLTYTFAEWHTTQNTAPNQQSNVEVRKAVAKALSAFVVSKSASDALGTDNMKSEAFAVSSYQWRLGSLYPTQQPVETAKEAYFQSQSMWDGGILDCKRPNAVSYTQFNTNVAAKSDGDGIVSVSLERSDQALNGVLNTSGNPTNNSKVLSANITYSGAVATRKEWLFMKHLRVAKFYLDNSILSE